ncbi:S-adenosyl-L-methionine-dependent methyltransferase [Dichotomocladium elegans]|nr:S-adenosyl-L-methionine-dependent methyltransferase [Dichotomocladium elegans]
MRFFDFLRFLSRKSNKDSKKKSNLDATIPQSPTHDASNISDVASVSKSGVDTQITSISSSPLQHHYENGRRYYDNEDIAYLLPDDIEDDDRMYLQHWAVRMAFGSNFDAPVTNALNDGINVLDSACGPGAWTLEMANKYPNSKFYGTDISPRFPNQFPSNCEFLAHNIVDTPPFGENYFDYAFQRLVILGIKKVDWPKVIENIKFTLKPGGWIELTEFSYFTSQNVGPNIQLVVDLSRKIMTAAGLDLEIQSNLSRLLSEAGFTNIQVRTVDVPINHGGKMGNLFWQDSKEAFTSAKHMFTKFHPDFEKPGVFDKFIEDIGEESKVKKWTMPWTRAIAQKPLAL